MSRDTTSRKWTKAELTLAQQIVLAVDAGEGRLVGSLSVAREVGLPYKTTGEKERAIAKIYDVMPLAAIICPTMLPEKALVVNADRTYRVTDAVYYIHKANVIKVKKMRTEAERIGATVSALNTKSDAISEVMVAQINSLLESLSPEVWDPIIAAVEAA